ncbi:tetratricopeptide repeat protein [Ferruginibacter sp.]
MKKIISHALLFFFNVLLCVLISCNNKNKVPSVETINAINLKKGNIVSCGPAEQQLGTVEFITSCSPQTKKDFNVAMALLHSFEYDEAEKVFAKIIDAEPACAMAYWGVAMSNYHPLWAPPTPPELQKGAAAIAIAKSLIQQTGREADYIDAMELFYKDWSKVNHRTRAVSFEKAMEKIYKENPAEKEAAIFYALALAAAADPADKSFANQKKAYTILTALYPNEPDHPGIVHYTIHSYDYPELAALALPAARKYAAIAPSSAHAQHMPSHIFTRLGLWDECITSNTAAAASAKCYAEAAGIKGHWDEELHALDYLVYAYLQKGDNILAKKEWDYLKTITEVSPVNFKVAYAFAAIPSRYVLENKLWEEAAGIKDHTENFAWDSYPWQNAILHFTRALGAANIGNMGLAGREVKILYRLYDTLIVQKDSYKANQVSIQIKTAEAWILLKEGKANEAIKQMAVAAAMEDKTEKNAVTPGEVIPAKELLGDMLLQLNKPADALVAYEADLQKHPNRFNGLYGAAVACEKINNTDKAGYYYKQLLAIANSPNANRPEMEKAKLFLKKDGK